MNKIFDIILDKLGIYFILVDRKGNIIKYSENADRNMHISKSGVKNIKEVFFPEGIWKDGSCNYNIEVLWDLGDFTQHYLFQSIPVKEGYILCFMDEKPFEIRVFSSLYEYDLPIIPGISSEVRVKAEDASRSDLPVLITGESGVGKEVLARAIHRESKRKGNFIPLCCASMPESLIESELFGYEPGSFTGADKGGRPGKFEIADGGTVFLDEIGDMTIHLQTKLLRVIEDKEVWRIGAKEGKKVDFKLICATNHNLRDMVKNSSFRKDLYYRLSGIQIHLPPLRERMEYFEDIVEYLSGKYSAEHSINFSDDVWDALVSYKWPGNIRELEMVIRHLIVKIKNKKGNEVRLEDLPEKIKNREELRDHSLKSALASYEKSLILDALKKNSWNITKTAEKLNITRYGLQKKIRKLNIKRNANNSWQL